MKIKLRFHTNWLGIAASICLFSGPVMSQTGISPTGIQRIGQSGWQFLKINSDPRQAALGGVFLTSHRPNANAVFGNPALLSQIDHYDVQFSSFTWLADIKYFSFAVAKGSPSLGTFALSVVTLNYGDIPETVYAPLQGGGAYPLITGNNFTASDLAAGVSYARKITQQLSIGGNVRFIREDIAGTGMSNWSFDFSTLYYTGLRSLRMAITARNFGPDAHLVGYSEELQSEPVDIRMPLELRGAIAYDLLEGIQTPHLLTLIVEGRLPSDGKEKVHLATEYEYGKLLSVRAGYRFNYDEEGLTLGMGFHFPIGGSRFEVNYAYLDYGALTQVNMFSFGLAL